VTTWTQCGCGTGNMFDADRYDCCWQCASSSRCDHDGEWTRPCQCARGSAYCAACYGSCYDCYLDRRADYEPCVYCGTWHSPEFETCYGCRRADREEAGRDLKLVILARDGFRCRYCGAAEGDPQHDPRVERPRCPPRCAVEHNHRWPCRPGCRRRHRRCYEPGDGRACLPGCRQPHEHLARDDDGIRPARLHVDHVLPCARGGTADPWNLQVLCGVCNVAKGTDWAPGSRHHQARRLLIAAYSTYLNPYLSDGERARLAADAEAENVTAATARQLVVGDYARRVRARRPRPPGRCDDRTRQPLTSGGPHCGAAYLDDQPGRDAHHTVFGRHPNPKETSR
jgi:HNH endonuclease